MFIIPIILMVLGAVYYPTVGIVAASVVIAWKLSRMSGQDLYKSATLWVLLSGLVFLACGSYLTVTHSENTMGGAVLGALYGLGELYVLMGGLLIRADIKVRPRLPSANEP